jgi:hypothetical protein
MGFIADIIGATNKYKADGGLPQEIDRAELAQALSASLQGKGIAGSEADAATQRELINTLQGDVAGTGPSVAMNQLRGATDANQKTNAAQLAGVRGLNPAISARLIAQGNAESQQKLASDAATLRAQEQIAARAGLGQALSEKRAADIQGFGAQTQRAGNIANTFLSAKQEADRVNAGVAGQNAQTNAGIGGGLVGGVASGLTKLLPFAEGGEVPGMPRVPGDSPVNDTVPIMASPGEVVLPRTVANDPDEAKAFVAALKKKDKKPSYGDVLERLRAVEGMFAGGRVGYASGGAVKAPTPAQDVQDAFLKNLGASYLKSRLVKAGA